MSAAVVITFLNEAGSLVELLEALASQTCLPDEVVLVDGGSEDASLQVAQGFSGRLPGFRLLTLPGSNISQGRNHGIATARSELIAVTDAGCAPIPTWLESLLEPFQAQPPADMVGGDVIPRADSHLEACIAACSLAYRIRLGDASLLPTARSLAFRRDLWERLGGFPARLDYGEDTCFMLSAVEAGARLVHQSQAAVRWRPRRTYAQVMVQFYHYADGLARAGLSWKFHALTLAQSAGGLILAVVGLTFRSWIPWALLLVLAAAYLLRKALQGCFAIPSWRTVYRVPLVLAAIHLGTLAGAFHGNWARLGHR